MGYASFVILSSLLVLSALGVVLSRSPVRSALSLILVMVFLAVTFAMLDAHLVAALQIVVYAGAIMILFLFVIMLLNLQEDPPEQRPILWCAGAWAAGAVTVGTLIWTVAAHGPLPGPGVSTMLPAGFGTTAALGERLFTRYVLPFEITSILLLVAIVGAVVLAMRRLE